MPQSTTTTPARHKVLVAPLDWGLGHATRCIPVIGALLEAGHEVWLAAEGPQAILLREAFPHLPLLALEGYQVQYSRKAVMLNILMQVPGIARSVAREHQWLHQMVESHGFTWVVSDNRYGLWHPGIRCTLITHQLALCVPRGMGWASGLVNRQLRRWVNRFSECWVPDIADADQSLSGKMGHPARMPAIPVRYVGWLTRFNQPANPVQALYQAVIILSGPEPQRSLLEAMVLRQLPALPGRFVLVRGLPGATMLPAVPSHTEVHNHLPSPALLQKIREAGLLISRSGYSTVMDAFALGKKCLFIPTPGQTEQEYLAERLSAAGLALWRPQADFQLAAMLEEAGKFPFRTLENPGSSGLVRAIQE